MTVTFEIVVRINTDVATVYTDDLGQFIGSFAAEVVCIEADPDIRRELHGFPKIAGYVGPCWGGLSENDDPIIRYEDHGAHIALAA